MAENSTDEVKKKDLAINSENPYKEVDVTELPQWWQDSIQEFEENGLHPYCPPQFNDGEMKHNIVEQLESKYDVEIDFIGLDPSPGDEWHIRVDGEPIETVGHHRASGGYSIFEIDSGDFADLITENVQ